MYLHLSLHFNTNDLVGTKLFVRLAYGQPFIVGTQLLAMFVNTWKTVNVDAESRNFY